MAARLYSIGFDVGSFGEAVVDGSDVKQKPGLCDHCHGSVAIRNPMGFCDHLYFPDYCRVCKRMRKEKERE